LVVGDDAIQSYNCGAVLGNQSVTVYCANGQHKEIETIRIVQC